MNHVKRTWLMPNGEYRPFSHTYNEPPFPEVSLRGSNDQDPKSGCLGIIIGILLAALLLWLLPSCASSRHTNVEKAAISSIDKSDKTRESEVLDSLYAVYAVERSRHNVERSHDTVIVNTTTIVREVDSAELSRYGIMLEGQKRAFLVQEKQLRERISMIELAFADSMRVMRDSLRSLRSRNYSLDALTKSSVKESETREVRKSSAPPLWPIWLTAALVIILYVIHYRHHSS